MVAEAGQNHPPELSYQMEDGLDISERATTEAATSDPLQDEDSPADHQSKRRIAIVMAALSLCVFLAALDITIVSTALPKIVAQFKASDSAYSWIASSYLLANASFVPLWGRLSDIWGRKLILTTSVVLFICGSLMCGVARNVTTVIAGRAIQGVGSGGIIVLANLCVSDLFNVRRRSAYLGIFGATWAIAGAVGPIIGGAFTTYSTWRWCFYINLPIGGISLLSLLFFLKIDNNLKSIVEGLRAIDWIGLVLIVGATLMFLLGLEFGGSEYPWASATVICLIIFGIVTAIIFGLNEWKVAPTPIIPISIFSNWYNFTVLVINFCHGMVFIGACFYLPVYFQNVLLATSLMSGVYLLPLVVALSISSGAAGFYMRTTGRSREVIILGMFLTTLGHGLYIDLKPYACWSRIIIYQIIAGLGIGPNFQATLIALQANTKPSELARGTATFSFVRQIAASVSVVAGSVVYGHIVSTKVELMAKVLGQRIATEIAVASTAAAGIIESLPGGEDRQFVFNVLTDALTYVWILYTAIAGFGFLISLTLKDLRLGDVNRQESTEVEKGEGHIRSTGG
ncbi:efflux pump antibiotic resistance protein, putative [Talaromyces stipitatus ATCC 10500]|uniref:Efflux pump antibiotic resistance protein, putative n=1 Tax=Talaromyces stipitatus (strain ATCC 10500 / CBS 375.48 / QM 6759 / NRRL 1006) TaxID=441959 RepID=B8MDQ9_TALSN|nr:efflux pump antibiotic resistance protein, putative [Talaromyces stipitatus ATCC 10500]EED18288.1 efflux pump antibiotic resistance protein, putative [Talaromyces stipitatus ATCC 10500]